MKAIHNRNKRVSAQFVSKMKNQHELWVLHRRPRDVWRYTRAWNRAVSCVRISPSAYTNIFVGTLACAQIDLRKTRERELATFYESRRATGLLNPMRNRIESTNQGREGTTPATTACPEVQKEKSEEKTKKQEQKQKRNMNTTHVRVVYLEFRLEWTKETKYFPCTSLLTCVWPQIS